jgi:hypothetical protein
MYLLSDIVYLEKKATLNTLPRGSIWIEQLIPKTKIFQYVYLFFYKSINQKIRNYTCGQKPINLKILSFFRFNIYSIPL